MIKNIIIAVVIAALAAYIIPPFVFNDYRLKSAQNVAIDLVVLPILYLLGGGRQK